MTSTKDIPYWKMNRLIKLGEDIKSEFVMPPFIGNVNEGAFNIDCIRTTFINDMIVIIKCLGFDIEYARKDEALYMVVKMD